MLKTSGEIQSTIQEFQIQKAELKKNYESTCSQLPLVQKNIVNTMANFKLKKVSQQELDQVRKELKNLETLKDSLEVEITATDKAIEILNADYSGALEQEKKDEILEKEKEVETLAKQFSGLFPGFIKAMENISNSRAELLSMKNNSVSVGVSSEFALYKEQVPVLIKILGLVENFDPSKKASIRFQF